MGNKLVIWKEEKEYITEKKIINTYILLKYN